MSVKDSLNNFGKNVARKSRANLKKKKKNATGSLYKSLRHELKVSQNSFELTIFMAPYGEYVDKGVKGVGGTKKDGSAWKKKRVTNNDYSYKNKMPPANAFSGWIVKKGFAPRNEKGQFTSRKSMQFAIARSIYHTGLETTNFISDPFKDEFKKLPDKIIESYGLDVDSLFKTSLANNKIK